jgi:hypothetical protein
VKGGSDITSNTAQWFIDRANVLPRGCEILAHKMTERLTKERRIAAAESVPGHLI